jgi:hypothetical protein
MGNSFLQGIAKACKGKKFENEPWVITSTQ